MARLPSWVQGEFYKLGQEKLFKTGGDILSGELNEYYKPIGQEGGFAFENMLASVRKDVSTSVMESAAKRGARGGRYAVGEAMSRVTPQLREKERTRSLGARERLLGTGLKTVKGVVGSDLSHQQMINQFNINRAKLEMMQEQAEAVKKARKNKMMTNIISSVIGAGAIMMTGGAAAPTVAAQRGMAGRASGGATGMTGRTGMGMGSSFANFNSRNKSSPSRNHLWDRFTSGDADISGDSPSGNSLWDRFTSKKER